VGGVGDGNPWGSERWEWEELSVQRRGGSEMGMWGWVWTGGVWLLWEAGIGVRIEECIDGLTMDGSTSRNPMLKRERVRVYRAFEDDTLTAAFRESGNITDCASGSVQESGNWAGFGRLSEEDGNAVAEVLVNM